MKLIFKTIQHLLSDPKREPWRFILFSKSEKFKEYPRAKKIYLPKPEELTINLQTALLSRVSERTFAQNLTVSNLSTQLYWSFGILSNNKRSYPSGGALYPLEVYVVIINTKNIESGVFHYNVKQHVLEKLPFAEIDSVISALGLDEMSIGTPSAIIFLSFVEHRSHKKYGIFSNKLSLLEAGHAGQNFYLVASAIGSKTCALGLGAKIHTLNDIFRLDGIDECIIYGFVLGA